MKNSNNKMATTVKNMLMVAGICGVGVMSDASAATVTYDLANDFSIASNPNGAWSYGYSTALDGTFTAHTANGDGGQYIYWNSNIGGTGNPSVSYNESDSYIYMSNIRWPAHTIGFHPGPNGEYSIVRFTAPTSGLYSLNSYYGGIDMVPTTTDVHMLLNGSSLFNANINGFQGFYDPNNCIGNSCANAPASGSYSATYNGAIQLYAGDTLDFAVGMGSNGNFISDATLLSVTLSTTTVPVPAAAWLFGSGLLGLVGVARRKAA